MRRVEIFVDYDGTITTDDTFDVLVRHLAGEGVWLDIERKLDDGEMSLRDALAYEASLVTWSFAETEAFLAERIAVDPSFAPFVATSLARGHDVTIVSSGIDRIVEARLARIGVAVPVIANGIDADPAGWRIRFRDPVPNGTDKAAIVRAARERGSVAVFVGDGRSDYDAMLVAERRFVKRGRVLERVLRAEGVPFEAFDDFTTIATALAPTPAPEVERSA